MIIVQGVFRVAPEDREQYLTESLENQQASRADGGCVEYVLAADPVEPDRVILSERWNTRADLDAHIQALMARRAAADDNPGAIQPLSSELTFFEADEIQVM